MERGRGAQKNEIVGQHLSSPSISCPVAIVDRAVIKRNCIRMLEAVDALGVGFRVHIKTHKTIEGTRLQVGDFSSKDGAKNEKKTTGQVNLIVSTVAEAEHISPYLRELVQEQKRPVSLLYGVPPSTSCFTRLQKVASDTDCELAFLVDHPAQLAHLTTTATATPASTDKLQSMSGIQDGQATQDSRGCVKLWIKIDTGYHRAGVLSSSQQFKDICAAISKLEGEQPKRFALEGLYSHLGSSYGGSSPDDALSSLAQEVERGIEAMDTVMQLQPALEQKRRLTLSVGATPTVVCIENLVMNREMLSETGARALKRIQQSQQRYNVELHAGVYPFLDLQQLATRARPSSSEDGSSGISEKDIGIRILAEVLCVYEHDRHGSGSAAGKPEALIGAGVLALAREPCKSYPGWGVLAPPPWTTDADGQSATQQVYYDEHGKTGWMVNRIAQEHGILTWEGAQEKLKPLEVGSKVMVWPNHACIAAANFDRLIVVDESVKDGCEVVDVWQRCSGW